MLRLKFSSVRLTIISVDDIIFMSDTILDSVWYDKYCDSVEIRRNTHYWLTQFGTVVQCPSWRSHRSMHIYLLEWREPGAVIQLSTGCIFQMGFIQMNSKHWLKLHSGRSLNWWFDPIYEGRVMNYLRDWLNKLIQILRWFFFVLLIIFLQATKFRAKCTVIINEVRSIIYCCPFLITMSVLDGDDSYDGDVIIIIMLINLQVDRVLVRILKLTIWHQGTRRQSTRWSWYRMQASAWRKTLSWIWLCAWFQMLDLSTRCRSRVIVQDLPRS